MAPYILPSKVFTYLRRLLLNYEHADLRELATVVKNGQVAVDPLTDRYSEFGHENIGHDVVIFLPPDVIAPISLEQQTSLSDRLRQDLAVCARGISLEYIHAVRIELQDEDDFLFDMAQPLSGPPPVNPEALTFWKRGQIRLVSSIGRCNTYLEPRTWSDTDECSAAIWMRGWRQSGWRVGVAAK